MNKSNANLICLKDNEIFFLFKKTNWINVKKDMKISIFKDELAFFSKKYPTQKCGNPVHVQIIPKF